MPHTVVGGPEGVATAPPEEVEEEEEVEEGVDSGPSAAGAPWPLSSGSRAKADVEEEAGPPSRRRQRRCAVLLLS